jgi:DNA-binding LytR/AlgR family response regulator
MPEMNGLDFMKTLVNKPLVILATAYPQYALDSYELEVVDYLLKPIRLERFLKAVNKAQNYFDLLQAKDVQPNKIENIGHDFVYIKADRKYFKIFFNQILYIEGLKDYVIIYTEDQKVVTAMNLKTIFDQLPAAVFARISKSYIVNTNKITSFDSFNVYINDTELSLGQRFKDDFFKNFVEQKIAKR